MTHKLLEAKESLHKIQCRGVNCTRIKANPLSRSQFVVSSKDTTLQVWDINTGSNVWNARSMSNDYLDLQVRVWDTDCVFNRFNDDVVYTTTGYTPSVFARNPIHRRSTRTTGGPSADLSSTSPTATLSSTASTIAPAEITCS